MNVIIFGPPGAGKGTQSQNIVKKFNLFQVSTGDLLRNEIKNKTQIGKEIEVIISRGDLTPTSSVLDTVEEKTEDTPEIPENNN